MKENILIRIIAMCLVLTMIPIVTVSAHPFIDVPINCWYDEAVQYVYENGLMNGTGNTMFSPNNTMDRGMITTVLYRMSGSPAVNCELPFDDVLPNHYFYNAICWAYQNGIVNGVSETEFMPLRSITRAEMVTMFYRNFGNNYKASETELKNYVDSDRVPNFAYDAFAWSIKNGIVNGTSATTLSPFDTANRAQCAVIIQRLNSLHEHDFGEWQIIKEATAKECGFKERSCLICGKTETSEIPKLVLSENIVAYYKVISDKVIDLVSGNELTNTVVDNGYFSGGIVRLPQEYNTATIETVMIYNRDSLENPISDNLAYYGGAFRFRELEDMSMFGLIKTPFGGGQISTPYMLNTSVNYDRPVLKDGESYWCLAFDKEAGKYALQINDQYVEKSHWCGPINKTFNLSKEHQFKEFIVYSTRLTQDEMMKHFKNKNISTFNESDVLIGKTMNGIENLGSAFAFEKAGQYGIPKWLKTVTDVGTYQLDNGNGKQLEYTISEYVEPDLNIDNSKYESVHIIKKPETLYIDYKYALTAIPYPFDINHDGKSDQYDVSWNVSDESIASIIDGLLIPKKTGTVIVTATLRGTTISDNCTIKIIEKEKIQDNILNISESYISNNGNYFSNVDYEMTTRAIYDAIDEAHEQGYNHIIFPKINFYASPIDNSYYIPTDMTIEFPAGSVFYMMPSEKAKTDGYTYFQMGGGWWSCNIPTDKYYAKTNDNGDILGYYCRNSHLIIDKYYGEFYKENATINELIDGANQYKWGCTLLSIGKRAEYCTVEIREATCPTGFFILMGGKGNNEMINASGGCIESDDFVHGWLDDTGTIVENDNWVSTSKFFAVSPGAANGMDTLHEYYFGNWEHNAIAATQHLYDVLWFDENYELIQINRWQYVDEGYDNKPDNAKYFKLSLQQSELPTIKTESCIGLYPDESSRFCEIKNTNLIHGADGLASVVGATEACWIHDNYISCGGLLNDSCWSLDLEDGWQGMRGTIIEHNIFKMCEPNKNYGEYRGKDTGILALSGGYNTFVISNYIGAIQQAWSNIVNTHIINNVIYSRFGHYDRENNVWYDLKSKGFAHVYYNTFTDGSIQENTNINGINYHYGNNYVSGINKW